MKRLDQFTGAVLFVFSVYYLFEASKMPMEAGKAPGAGWLPAVLAMLMAFLAALLVISSARRSTLDDQVVSWPRGRGLANNLAILGGLAASVALLQIAGYLISTFLFLLGLLLFLGRYSWKFSTAISALSTTVLYWVFKIWLEIPLPPGIINIL